MKKILAVILAISMLMMSTSAFALSEFDMSLYESSSLFNLDVDTETGITLISTVYSDDLFSFRHKNEADHYISLMRNYISVVDVDGLLIPQLAATIAYRSKKPLNISEITFVVPNITNDGEVRNTFYDFEVHTETIDGDNHEYIMLSCGANNLDFFGYLAIVGQMYLSALEESAAAAGLSQADDMVTLNASNVKMILHGTEDVEVDVPGAFLIDLVLLFAGVTYGDNQTYFELLDGTPYTKEFVEK